LKGWSASKPRRLLSPPGETKKKNQGEKNLRAPGAESGKRGVENPGGESHVGNIRKKKGQGFGGQGVLPASKTEID